MIYELPLQRMISRPHDLSPNELVNLTVMDTSCCGMSVLNETGRELEG